MTISDGFKSNSDKAKFDNICLTKQYSFVFKLFMKWLSKYSKHIFYEQNGILYMFSVLYNGYLSSKVFDNNNNNNC